jgi:hypothetical protein
MSTGQEGGSGGNTARTQHAQATLTQKASPRYNTQDYNIPQTHGDMVAYTGPGRGSWGSQCERGPSAHGGGGVVAGVQGASRQRARAARAMEGAGAARPWRGPILPILQLHLQVVVLCEGHQVVGGVWVPAPHH